MAYRKSNDNWKQMLIRLDEMGERAFFMHLLVTRGTTKHIQRMRTSESGRSLKSLFQISLMGRVRDKADECLIIYRRL